MLEPVQLTSGEKDLLEDWRRYSSSSLIRDRALVIIVNSRGKSAHFIAGIFSRKNFTAYFWINEFKLKEIRDEIKPLLGSSDWVVLASDETRLVWESESRRAWLEANKKIIIEQNQGLPIIFGKPRF